MSLRIAGMGWVTPLGSGVDPVWQRLLEGDEACPEKVSERFADRSYPVFRVPDSALKNLPTHPRLRRASPISRFAVAAGLEALEAANVKLASENSRRVALIFATSNGGVIYTRRFYSDIVESGAQTASPLLFPETVFNAPASHLAAILGITGATYTLVGDGAVGILAIKMAEDLMANHDIDYCLVVGAEEIDWFLCDAYCKWRLLRSQPPVEPFSKVSHGTVLSEGAGALLFGREGKIEIGRIHPGANYHKRAEAEPALKQILADLAATRIDIVITSANGTFIDRAESAALSKVVSDAPIYTAKPAMGEGVAAAGLWQVIIAAKALADLELPAVLHPPSTTPLSIPDSRATLSQPSRAIVLICGMNQQIAGLCVQLVK